MPKKKPPQYKLTMAKDKAPVELASLPFEMDATETVNRIVKALSVAEFRGGVQFTITKDSAPIWATTVSFTDDIPEGVWNTTHS